MIYNVIVDLGPATKATRVNFRVPLTAAKLISTVSRKLHTMLDSLARPLLNPFVTDV